MKRNPLQMILGMLALACAPAVTQAAVVATTPALLQQVPGAGGADFAVNITLPADAVSPIVGYDVAFTITGPTSAVTITGVDVGNHPANSVFATDPLFSKHIAGGTTVYAFSDFLLAGSGTIGTGEPAVLLRLKLHAAEGTTGAYALNFVTDAASPFKSVLYADASLTAVPAIFQGGSITFGASVPEPSSMALLGGLGALFLLRRRRVVS